MKLSLILGAAMLFSSDVWALYGVGLVEKDSNLDIDGVNCSFIARSENNAPWTKAPSPVSPPSPPTDNVDTTPVTASTESQKIAPPSRHDTSTSLPTSPASPIYTSFANLSTPAKAGLISGFSILVLSIFLILLEVGFLRRNRRERALRRAVREVERDAGMELKTIVESRSESKENMALESKESLVLESREHQVLERKEHLVQESKEHRVLERKEHQVLKSKEHLALESEENLVLENKENMVLESCVEIIVVTEENDGEWEGSVSGDGEGWEAYVENVQRGRRDSRNGMSLPRRED